MRNAIALFMLAGVVTTIGCGDDHDFSIPDQEAAGSINAAEWTMAGAYAETDAFESSEIRVELHSDSAFEPCNGSAPVGDSLFFSVPAEPGRYELSFSLSGGGRSATFYDGKGSNVIASEGVIEIDDITEDEVSGGLNVGAGDGNSVAGFFAASRCPE